MQYLITTPDHEPALTHWFDIENHYAEGMKVYDLINDKYYDGSEWKEIVIDHL